MIACCGIHPCQGARGPGVPSSPGPERWISQNVLFPHRESRTVIGQGMPRPEISSAGHGMALCLAEELRAERDCHDFITVIISLIRRKFQRHMNLRLLKRARLSLSL